MNYPAAPSLVACGGLARPGLVEPLLGSRSQTATAPERVNVAPGAALASFIEWLAGILNFPRALAQPAKQSSRVFTVLRCPTPPFVCSVVHAPKHEPRSVVSARISIGDIRNV